MAECFQMSARERVEESDRGKEREGGEKEEEKTRGENGRGERRRERMGEERKKERREWKRRREEKEGESKRGEERVLLLAPTPTYRWRAQSMPSTGPLAAPAHPPYSRGAGSLGSPRTPLNMALMWGRANPCTC